jgi:hypothetical protein
MTPSKPGPLIIVAKIGGLVVILLLINLALQIGDRYRPKHEAL